MKRSFDIFISLTAILLLSPLLLLLGIAIFLQDFKNPIYVSNRVGERGNDFRFYKFRSMVSGADLSGVDSTSANDQRITFIGTFIRKFKLDELSQLINVLFGSMSLVGPRPNVKRDVAIYTDKEKKLLEVKPGVTDFSSIVFSDEGEILSNYENADIAYNQRIRPWKSRLGLIYIENHSFLLDLKIIFFTLIGIFSRTKALSLVTKTLIRLEVSKEIVEAASRKNKLLPYPPPGADKVVLKR